MIRVGSWANPFRRPCVVFLPIGGRSMKFPKLSRRKWIAILVVLGILAIPAWYLGSPLFIVTRANEPRPQDAMTIVATGRFADGDPGHRNSGDAILLTDGARFVLRFENFSVTNGPDIHVFLAKGPRYAAGDVDLGPVKATQGASNYDVPSTVNAREYRYVIIWCVPFRVQFGQAELTFR